MRLDFLRSLLTVFTGLMLLAGVAVAQDDSAIMERLGLSEAQKEQLKDLRDKFRTETEQLRSDIRRLLQEEKQIKSAQTPNETQLRTVLKERADKEVDLSLALTRFNDHVENILTPAQRKELDKMRSEKHH
jgi:Spy/CpxP family protein refolding chaperone